MPSSNDTFVLPYRHYSSLQRLDLLYMSMSLRRIKNLMVDVVKGFIDSGGGGGKKKKKNSNDSLIDTVMVFANGDELNEALGSNLVSSTPKVVNEVGMNDVGTGPTTLTANPGHSSSYADVTCKPSRTKVIFRALFTPWGNTWGKYGLVRSMLSSSSRLYSFQFSSWDDLDAMLENGPWFIRNNPFILKKWQPDVNLLKDDELKDNIVVAMPKITGESFYTCNVHVEYEWKPPRPSQTPKGIPVGRKIGFKPTKQQVYQPISKMPTVNISGNKKKNVETTKELSKSNSFDMLNLVENDVKLGTNGGTSHLASQEANYSGSSSWNVDSSSPNTTTIKKIDKMEKLIIYGKVTLVDNDEKP
nr:hypothetical protein [Tanacetum cinerariifolium]